MEHIQCLKLLKPTLLILQMLAYIPIHLSIPLLKLQLTAFNSILNLEFKPPLNGSHALSITSLHLSSRVHIASKKNILFNGLEGVRCHKYKAKRKWSKVDIDTWWTLASGNNSLHSSLATILSNLITVRCSPNLSLHHVNLCPTKPIFVRPQLSKYSLKALIWFASHSSHPNFSSEWVISLKSPKINHGISHCFFRASISFQEICLILESGWL